MLTLCCASRQPSLFRLAEQSLPVSSAPLALPSLFLPLHEAVLLASPCLPRAASCVLAVVLLVLILPSLSLLLQMADSGGQPQLTQVSEISLWGDELYKWLKGNMRHCWVQIGCCCGGGVQHGIRWGLILQKKLCGDEHRGLVWGTGKAVRHRQGWVLLLWGVV